MKEVGELVHLFACGFLFNFSIYMVIPAITDVTMEALCPGQDQCSLAIYLSGLQQAVVGLGTLIATPIVGTLSDRYGRKALLMLPMIAAILPVGILAFGRSKTYIYAYYVISMLTGMFCEGSMQSLALAYVADKVSEAQRMSAIAILSGIMTAGLVTGTLATRFLPTSYVFQVSAAIAVLGAAYMVVFLEEIDRGRSVIVDEETSQSLLSSMTDDESSPRLPVLGKKMSLLMGMFCIFSSSLALTRAAVIAFFNSIADSGIRAPLFYYLKAQFQFSKDQFADLSLICGVTGAFSQLLLMPLLAPVLGEEKLLNIGILASCANILLYSVTWSKWVPYIAAMFTIMSNFIQPCIRSIVSQQVGPSEQGMAQGCITGIISFATIMSPLIFTPLTAWFLSENAPFNFKGFSMLCVGFFAVIAFAFSIVMPAGPRISQQKL